MSRNTGVPNAWDDDWETQADKAAAQETKQPQIKKLLSRGAGAGTGRHSGSVAVAEEEEPQMTRAERLAKHEEENRRIWNSAENPEEFHFLTAGAAPGGGALLNANSTGSSGPTLLSSATAFRPQMTVLSRKPAPRVLRRRDPVTGIEQLTIHDDAAEAEAEAAAAAARNQETPEQIRQRLQREREAKQRKYDEARAKIFGEPLPSSSSNNNNNNNSSSSNNNNNPSTPGSSLASSRQASPVQRGHAGSHTPPQSQQVSGHSTHHNNNNNYNGRGRARGRGQGGGHRGDRGQHDNSFRRQHQPHQQHQYQHQQQQQQNQQQYPSNSATHSPVQASQPASQLSQSTSTGSRELYDPNYSPKPQSQQRRQQGGGGHHHHHHHHHHQASGTGSASGSDATGSPLPSRTGTPREEEFVMRSPRGPDGSGRGGFGFARRSGLQSG